MTHVDDALRAGLVQPDQRTCGSASLTVARMVTRPGYAEFIATGADPDTGRTVPGPIPARFQAEALALHPRTNGFLDAQMRLQLPWPRALGTAPWATANEMTASCGVPGSSYTAKLILPNRRGQAFDAVRDAAKAGHPVPVYVGNSWSPRHIVLALPPIGDSDRVRLYEPARGARIHVDRDDFAAGKLDLAGWSTPWFTVLPSR
ncbi:hypothetical protein [Nocardioides speluncae]|uniref:hypothetical protein n=1 Tax=Nocardioides speluncae TaxID=2670337 RepID=UPI000D6947B3|nr:hypothetical protein [Nocardioides speluncae]